MIRDIQSPKLLKNIHVVESLKTIIHSLEDLLNSNKLTYSLKIELMYFLSELCKKFFYYPNILLAMKTKIKESDGNEYEEIVVFSMLLNLFKTDQLILEYENKKLVKINQY